jgi:hypothetical protein
MNMDDLEKAIREAEAANELPGMPESANQQVGGEMLSVDFPDKSEENIIGEIKDSEGRIVSEMSFLDSSKDMSSDDIAGLLRELIDVVRQGFGI